MTRTPPKFGSRTFAAPATVDDNPTLSLKAGEVDKITGKVAAYLLHFVLIGISAIFARPVVD